MEHDDVHTYKNSSICLVDLLLCVLIIIIDHHSILNAIIMEVVKLH